MERVVGFRQPRRRMLGRLVARTGIAAYVGTLGIVTAMLLALAIWLLPAAGPSVFVTSEEPGDICLARLHHICQHLGASLDEQDEIFRLARVATQ